MMSGEPRYWASSGLERMERSITQKTLDKKTPKVALDLWKARPRCSRASMSALIMSVMKCDRRVELSGLTSKGVVPAVVEEEPQFPSPREVRMEANGPE